MMLFSWFSHNSNGTETTLRLSNRKNKKRLNIKGKSMWPVAKVRQIPDSLININKSVETNLNPEDFIKDID
ncbi:hypothetical protein RI844_01450 [Thalassotalea fonticola]|uniref:Uncharacterized protein n=1 Tax=Thalassotalea fonticola TaxID=3065649 RepID=A0ABZ0GQP3_9GAMM|nr:hypothetical protein RI844_01450 [Colwelliaceae bacterium S1-1]